MKGFKLGNKENETIVIASIISKHDDISDVAEILTDKDFFHIPYSKIFKKALELYHLNKILDSIQLCESVELQFTDFVQMITDYSVLKCNLIGAAQLVKEYSLKRQIKQLTIKANSDVEGQDVFEVIEKLQAELEELTNIKSNNILPAPVLAAKFLEKQYERLEGKKRYPTFGIRNFDNLLGPLMPGVTIIAARPSIGKTALAISAMWNMINDGFSVGFLSLEMPLYQIMMRFMSISERIPLNDLRRFAKPEEIIFFTKYFTEKFSNFKYCLDDTGGLNEIGIKNRLKKMKKLYDIDIAFIDYIGLSKSSAKKENRANEVSHVSSAILNSTKELDIPIVVLAQINRDAEKHKFKEPSLGDMRDTGSLEQDATTVIGINRPEFYKLDKFSNGEYSQNKAQLDILKQRNGPTGRKTVGFFKDFGLFYDANDYGTPEEVPEQVQYLTDDDCDPF